MSSQTGLIGRVDGHPPHITVEDLHVVAVLDANDAVALIRNSRSPRLRAAPSGIQPGLGAIAIEGLGAQRAAARGCQHLDIAYERRNPWTSKPLGDDLLEGSLCGRFGVVSGEQKDVA